MHGAAFSFKNYRFRLELIRANKVKRIIFEKKKRSRLFKFQIRRITFSFKNYRLNIPFCFRLELIRANKVKGIIFEKKKRSRLSKFQIRRITFSFKNYRFNIFFCFRLELMGANKVKRIFFEKKKRSRLLKFQMNGAAGVYAAEGCAFSFKNHSFNIFFFCFRLELIGADNVKQIILKRKRRSRLSKR